jgi:hypothetical protein
MMEELIWLLFVKFRNVLTISKYLRTILIDGYKFKDKFTYLFVWVSMILFGKEAKKNNKKGKTNHK